MKKIGVIGTGIAGLAAAARLAAKGHKVTCFEANDTYGGKIGSFEQQGFRFDTGPSLFTLPHLVDEIFTAAGKDPRDYFRYFSKEVSCHYFYPDGTKLTAYTSPEKLAAEMEKVLGVKKQPVLDYFKRSRNKYNRVGKIFLEKPLHKTSTWLGTDVMKALLHLPSYNLFATMHAVNARQFDNSRLVQYFDRYATYNGSNPYAVPGLLTMIPYLEHGLGTYLPDGGMHSIASSVYQLCLDLGVHFHFNTRVDEILINGKKATGIMAGEEKYDFDKVICNMDIVPAYRKLMPNQKAPKKVMQQERSSSALIFYWGINREFPGLGLHNILFSGDYQTEFEHIFKTGKIFNDPTVYINITSRDIKTDAPTGNENWFVMINVPANKGYFTDEIKKQARKSIVQKINAILNTDIEKHIVFENTLDPVSIESKTGSLHGSLYGTSSNSRMSAFNRHPNFSPRIGNLYFCGGSVHPGGGIPLCLNSAKIVADLVK